MCDISLRASVVLATVRENVSDVHWSQSVERVKTKVGRFQLKREDGEGEI